MGTRTLVCALVLGAFVAPIAAMADDPRDPTMTPEAIARDRAIIKRLNEQQLAHVRQRDAGYQQGWKAYRNRGADNADYARRRNSYEAAQRSYAAKRSQYERDMAEWRRNVAACRAGNYSACDN